MSQREENHSWYINLIQISETGAAVHLYADPRNSSVAAVLPEKTDAASRVPLKRAWWTQYLNASLLATYPKMKGASTFEFIKHEETTWRDFSNNGGGTSTTSPFGGDGAEKDGEVLKAFTEDLNGPYKDMILWANATADAAGRNDARVTALPVLLLAVMLAAGL
jgi:hypothetical protein